jgi:hypothetical protein
MQGRLSGSQWVTLAMSLAVAGFRRWQFRNFLRTESVWHSFLRYGMNPRWELGLYILVLVAGLAAAAGVLEQPLGHP